MATHYIKPERKSLHGSFSKDLLPLLTIDSGDTVQFETLDMGWALEPWKKPGIPKRFERKQPEDQGHAICGPVYIRDAESGMTLEIKINHIRTGTWGWASAGGFPPELNDRLGTAGDEYFMHWKLNADKLEGISEYGHKIKLKPFMGIMGMPPNEAGLHATLPPRYCGGNIDCKELTAGSVLYLPIAVSGALFSVGDGHAAQGDGEVAMPALECPMEIVDLTFILHADMKIKMPRAHTADGWITFGFHEDINEATMIALDGMLDLMEELYKFERKEALALASLVVDLRITQIVNGVKGVHAVLPHHSIGKV
ncbi:acetamidase/formamidase family protein [Paenibacillus eucommiae]|uniref:Acetamidase/formamidase n=1 Tax=Paenibacillus eucommiae TaxID=1355755 RepID=A0ABS4J7X6_9BACL|nr:acetamidase/formamidase family protein [Paenibacillus eucommiae]MBP1995350.1 acetamidase/formamidase [Paenibacillus eucommiae]